MSLTRVRDCLAVLEIRLDLVPRWRGAELSRLLDEKHAQLATAWSRVLERWGWDVQAEVSFNHFGDRGRVDLLGWFAPLRILLVVEIKTDVSDIQDLLGSLDVKARIGPLLAEQAGWGRPNAVVRALIISDTSTNRRRVRQVEPLFNRFGLRGKPAISWLRRPSPGPSGLLILSILSSANLSRVRRVAPPKERVRRRALSVGAPAEQPPRDSDPAYR
jgi:hypothetical protein